MKPGQGKQWVMAIGFGTALALVALMGKGGLDLGTPAQAQSLAEGKTLVLSTDGFFVTTNSSGSSVYLWYFRRDGRRADSEVFFVSQAGVEGPKLDF